MRLVNSVSCGRVKEPGRNDWNKLVCSMKFLHDTQEDVLRLSVGTGSVQLEWFVDTSFVMHPDYRGHTSAAFRFKHSGGFPMQVSRKQKLNTSSGTTCELAGVDNVLPKTL